MSCGGGVDCHVSNFTATLPMFLLFSNRWTIHFDEKHMRHFRFIYLKYWLIDDDCARSDETCLLRRTLGQD